MGNLRSRLTYANVISTLCLFMLLGGGAYAATQLPKNSVGARQIRKGAVTGPKIRNGTIETSKLSASAAAALKAPTGPTGAQGPAGPRGAQGPQGTSNGGAYATVSPEDGGSFVGTHPGFAAIDKPEGTDGTYCLTPTAGTNIDHPLASVDWFGSGGNRARFVEPLGDSVVIDCNEGQLEVKTSELFLEPNPNEPTEQIWIPVLTNALVFTVFVPAPQ